MKKLTLALVVLLLTATASQAQLVAQKQEIFTAVANGTVVRLIGSGASFHKLTWNKIGTVTVCSIKVQQSATGTGGWSDLIAAQDCSSSGTTVITTGTPNYVRTITVTTFTGTGSVVSLYDGYLVDPTGITLSAVSGSLIPVTDDSLDLGDPTHGWRNVYYHNLVPVGGAAVTLEGAVAACTAAGASKGKLAFTTTGPQWSYNAGSCYPLFHAGNDNNFGAHFYTFTHITAPAAPAANNYEVYIDSGTGKLACLNSSSTSCMPSSAGNGAWTRGVTGLIAAPADSVNYRISQFGTAPGSGVTDERSRLYFDRAATIDGFQVYTAVTGTLGTTEAVTIQVWKNGAQCGSFQLTQTWDAATVGPTKDVAHTCAVVADDYVEINAATPAWVTNPTNVRIAWSIHVQ